MIMKDPGAIATLIFHDHGEAYLIPLGYPADRRPFTEVVHRGRWQS
jgi:hypothetical protein